MIVVCLLVLQAVMSRRKLETESHPTRAKFLLNRFVITC